MARFVQSMEAFDPQSGGVWTVGLEKSQIDVLVRSDGKINDGARLLRLHLVKEVVTTPLAVFKDWKRPEFEDGLCYCGKPKSDYLGFGKQVPAPKNMVFLVFVTQSGKISDWRWEKECSETPNVPEDFENRFGEMIWPR